MVIFGKRILFFSVVFFFGVCPIWSQTPQDVPLQSGYKGIWFALGQISEYGDKYSGGLGTYTAKHIPLAIYSPIAHKTFFVYGGTRSETERYLLCMVGSYDHRTKRVQRPVVVHDKEGVDDPHDNPSIAMDSQGHVWVFVSGRGRTRMGYKYRSTKPYDVTSFDLVSEEEMTYPQPKFVNGEGFLNLFTKYTGMRELYFETSEDGKNWTEDKYLVGMRRKEDKQSGHYQISGQWNNKVAFFHNWHPNGNVDRRTNIYYMQTEDFGETWTDIKGNSLTIPITDIDGPTLAAEYFTHDINVYIKDIGFDEKGNPVALFVHGPGHQPGPTHGPRTWSTIYWNGAEWEISDITTSDQNYDTGSIWVEGSIWKVIGPTKNEPQKWGAGGEIVEWISRDKGKSWTLNRSITKDSPRNHNYVRRVHNGKDPFLYFWADGDPNAFSKSVLYFGDSRGRVWALPYTMKNDSERPKRVRSFRGM